MNRIIKFRAYDKKEKKMYNEPRLSFGASLDGPFVSFLRNGQWIDCYFLSETVAVMQFTGLKDKNGKEIYDFDLVKFQNKVYRLEIDFVYGLQLYPVREGFNQSSWGGNALISELEVMGNIYENPDLIK